MKFRCNREKFVQLFKLASSVTTTRREVKAVLQNVKMVVEAEPARIILLASDMDLSIRLELSETVVVDDPGECILPTKLVESIFSLNTSEEEAEFEIADTKLFITLARSRYVMPTQSSESFPDIPVFDAKEYHEVAANVLRELIRRTRFATDTQTSRYTLNGVLFEFTDNRIASISSDGRRLAYQEGVATVVGDHFSENTSIFTVQSLNLFSKAIETEELVRISVNDNFASVQTGTTTIHCRLIDGRFPRWRNILPSTEGKSEVDFIVNAFARTFDQGQIMASRSEPVAMLRFSSGKLEVSAVSQENGDSSAEMPISYDGEDTEIKVNPRFIQEFLRELNSESVLKLYFSAKETILFQTDDGYSYVVMPLA